MAGGLDRGRRAFSERSWSVAYAELSAADRESPLGAEDLDRLAVAAYLIGDEASSVSVWTRTYHESVEQGDYRRAARSGFWLSHNLLLAGDDGQSRGWLARAQRLLAEPELDCVERGYLLVVAGLYAMGAGDAAGSYALSCQVAKIAERFGDPDLTAYGLLCRAKALIVLGETGEALGMLDEAIVAVTAREVSPVATGIIYCAAILACRSACDVRRAQEWTTALSDWCQAQPDLVPFRGQCLVHRSELLQLRGAWLDSLAEARRACQRLTVPIEQPALGLALYQRGELHRLRGELAEAEAAYRQASQKGRDPQPGLALLRLAQGRVEAAASAIRRAVGEARDRVARTRLLAAYIEIMLATDDGAAARAAADELAEAAAELGMPLLLGQAGYATGAVRLAAGEEADLLAALAALRVACQTWQELDAPYLAAQARVLVGVACQRLGDLDTARLEWDAAREVFAGLGAAPDLARVEQLAGRSDGAGGSGLSPRERQVLRLVAAGYSNREIAAELVLSEKTVERHLSNIFTKLDVPNRAAATGYAYRHGLA